MLFIRSDHWYIPQLHKDDIDVLINSVCTELNVFVTDKWCKIVESEFMTQPLCCAIDL